MDDSSEERPNQELGRGLIYIHEKLGTRILQHQDLAAHVYALTELLIANGTVSLRDFEARKTTTKDAMVGEALAHWEGARVLTDETDKYTVVGPDINCAERIHLCRAACCKLRFYLSKQDLSEQKIRWNVGEPYQILHRKDGYCSHCDPATKVCNEHQHRPLVCRRYDCRSDPRIWEDFENAIPNPALTSPPVSRVAD